MVQTRCTVARSGATTAVHGSSVVEVYMNIQSELVARQTSFATTATALKHWNHTEYD